MSVISWQLGCIDRGVGALIRSTCRSFLRSQGRALWLHMTIIYRCKDLTLLLFSIEGSQVSSTNQFML